MPQPDPVNPAPESASLLEQTLQELQAILEHASVGIAFSRNRTFVHCNPRLAEIFGWRSEELIGQPVSILYKSATDFLQLQVEVQRKFSHGEVFETEHSFLRKDGQPLHCYLRAKSIDLKDGHQSSIWVTDDISHRKALQEQLTDLLSDLENRVAERTKELAETNLRLKEEIEERKQIERTLLSSEKRFRDLSELSMDWFWEQDANFRFIEMSKGLLSTSLRSSSTLGKTRKELPIVGLTEADWQAHQKVLDAHLPFKDFVYQMETQPGEIHWFSISGIPLFEDGVFVGYRGAGTDITEQKKSEQKIQHMAFHDPLTGLPNRVLLEDRMQQAIAHAARTSSRLALLYLDLDNFKKINDSLGHTAGDTLLKEIALRLRECVRDTDTISRQGGDEFVLILNELESADDCVPVVQKILSRLQDPIAADGREFFTSASIGLAVYPEDGTDFESLRKKADVAMYQSKESGRNTYRFFDESMNQEAGEHLMLRNGIRRGLERHEFELYYQPQIDLLTGQVFGAEALLRWHHPELGLVPPAKFIPVAEESGLIVPLGEWVIFEACRQAVAWRNEGLPALQLAVNLSAVQFKRGHVEQTVVDALAKTGLNPAQFEMELTESILLQNIEQVLANVKRLKLLGVNLSIDDFGTGYSSLSYLKRLDIDKLKIDQSFIRDLASDPDDAAIVNAIVQMGHSLNLQVIAEGVEDENMLQMLRKFGCDQAQGYFFARPMPAKDFAEYLRSKLA
jgi:diguanylate cyclase (GGDEF)-like protein/PAS domain S-box-containing protein